MRRAGDDLARALLQAGARSAHECPSGADHVVEQHDGRLADIAGKQRSADDPAGAPLLQEGEAAIAPEQRHQCLAKQLCALDAARVRRSHDHGFCADEPGDGRREHRGRGEVQRRNPKRVVERRRVVHLESHHAGDTHGLEQLGHVARGHRIERPRAPVLARECQVGDHRCDAPGTVIAQRRGEKEQPQKLVGRGAARIAVEPLNQIDVLAADIGKRTNLVLAVLELELFVGRKSAPEFCGHVGCERLTCLQGEELHRPSRGKSDKHAPS